MYKSCILVASLGLAVTAGLHSTPASAAAANNTAFVNAGSGNDANAASFCPVTAPCATLNTALSVITGGGTVIIVGPGQFGPINITHQVAITGETPSTHVQIIANPAATPGCVGAAPGSCGGNSGFAVDIEAEADAVVKLSHMLFNSSNGTGAVKIGSGNVVNLTHDVFRGNGTTTGPIVSIVPGGSGHTEVYMSDGDVAFNKNGGAVLIAATGTNNARLHFNHMEVHHALFGIKTDASGLTGPANVNSINTFVSESEFFSFNGSAVTALTIAGSGGVNSVYNNVNVLNTAGPAVNGNGPGSFVILTNSTLGGNQIGVRSINNAQVISSINNTIKGNGTDISTAGGTTPGTFTGQPTQ
jgi:hypothetical protein